MTIKYKLERACALLRIVLEEVEDKCAQTDTRFSLIPKKRDVYDDCDICGECIGCQIFNFLKEGGQ